MACWLTALTHYLNQCWLFTNEVLWHSPENTFAMSAQILFCIRSLNNILLKSSPHFTGDRWVTSLTMFRHHPWPFTWSQIRIWTHLKLDESMARRHLKSPQSLSGRFLHLTLVTKWSPSWSWMPYSHPLCSMSIGPPVMRYSYFKIWPSKSLVKAIRVVKGQGYIWPWKFKGQGYGQGQTHWSH